MSDKKNKRRQKKRRFLVLNKDGYYDYSLLAVVVLLTCFGLVMLYSTSAYVAEARFEDDMYYFGKQAAISAGGIVCMVIISMFDYHILKNFTTFLYAAAMVLMLLVLSPLGVTVNGAKRWLKLGVQFQPSEIAKIAAIVCISYLIVQMGKQIQTLRATVVLLGIGGVLGATAYLATDNLSTGIIICGITWILVAMASPYTRYFVAITAVMFVLLVILVQILKFSIDTAESGSFRVQRVLVWLHPEQNSDAGGYQVMQALYAIGSGGFFGKGLGNSVQKLGSVPEAQNDMIFSIVCEELGIFGGALVLLLFAYLLYRLFFISQNAPDLFGSLLVAGIMIHIALQVILNICVVTNIIPTTGVTLPFVSYGGTSILFLMAEMGIALGVSHQIKLQEVEEESRKQIAVSGQRP